MLILKLDIQHEIIVTENWFTSKIKYHLLFADNPTAKALKIIVFLLTDKEYERQHNPTIYMM